MKLALNYSPQAAELLIGHRIKIDLFKCPNDWPELITTARSLCPVYVHFALSVGSGRFGSSSGWDTIQELLAETNTPYVNLHVESRVSDFPSMPMNPHGSQRVEVIDALLRDVAEAVSHFGSDRVIVENVPYRGNDGKFLRTAVEPEVLQRIVEETACGLLLDLPHARITSLELGINEREYLSQFPVHQLRELHTTGVQHDGQRLRDHMPMTDGDRSLLDWAIAHIHTGHWATPWAVTLEYGGVGPLFAARSDASVLEEEVPRLSRLVSS
jgi:uncharacterized protein (UPF0276 family)